MKKIVFFAVAIMMFASIFATVAFAEDDDAAIAVNFTAQNLYDGGSKTKTYTSAVTVSITDTELGGGAGYFASSNSFSLTDGQSQTVTIDYYDDGYQGDVTVTFVCSVPAPPEQKYTLSITSNNNSYGTVSTSTVSNITSGTAISAAKNVVTVSTSPATTITATATPNDADNNYAFVNWSNIPASITANRTITANFITSQYPIQTYDADDLYNGGSTTISFNQTTTVVIYDIESGSDAYYNTGSKYFTIQPGQTKSITIEAYESGEPQQDVTVIFASNANAILTVTSNNNSYGTVSPTIVNDIPINTAISAAKNVVTVSTSPATTITATATPNDADNNYAFVDWSNVPQTITGNRTITANFITSQYPIQTYDADDLYNGGSTTISFNQTTTVVIYDIESGSDAYYNTGIKYFTLQAGQSQSITIEAYESGEPQQDVTVIFANSQSPIILSDVYWSNSMYNSSVSMIFDFEASSNKIHTMTMDLLTGIVNNDNTTWTDTGYDLVITQSYPSTTIYCDLQLNGSSVDHYQATLGNWSKYQLTIDLFNGAVKFTPVKTFNSFTNYTLYSNQEQTIYDFSGYINRVAIDEIAHSETGNGSNHVRFSVVDTEVFLNTYGVVMNNPTINVYDHFPQYNSVRLNFYSFALYGSSFTINGITYALDGAQTTVSYVDSGKNHLTPSLAPGEPVLTKTMDVSNIYVTWDGSNNHVYLTFADNKFTIDLGTYTNGNETVSFSGLWYFTSVLYEPVTVTEKELGPWKALPDLDWNAMIILFLACLLIIGIIAYIKLEGGLLDAVILGAAALIGLMLLG